ncbi:hypothetical protein ABD91_25940 [Lysinibacillus sphaericus]|uniref:hypothetical protein n=1 Tax=Lysinibacillus sphaericus TaxID=1421 RepID=UPI0018CF5617|nr:hypothetical protein [Lysinibacillus sphaericus]MBG9694176.1 hypothetical protein [Lysinibacillus sphaericus]
MLHQKVKEIEYRKDYYGKLRRFKTGFAGEMAIAHLLEANFVDLTIGDSMNYRGSDMKRLGINIGIKTVEYGKFPIIHRNNPIPQIFVVKKSDTFYVLGVATPEVLNSFQDDQFILDKNIRKAGYKTSFTGLSRLEPFYDMDQLLLAVSQ